MYDYKNLGIMELKAKFYSKELWGISCDLPIVINNRLRTANARIDFETIELNKNYVNISEFMLDDILLHEMCHWYCYTIGQDYRDHSLFFEKELMRIGATRTDSIYFDKKEWFYLNRDYIFRCKKCNKIIRINEFGFNNPHKEMYGYSECCKIPMRYDKEIRWWDIYKPNYKLLILNGKFQNKIKEIA